MVCTYNSLHGTPSIPVCCRLLPIHATTTRLTKAATFQQTRGGSTSLVCHRLRFVGVFLTPSKGSDSLSRREPALSFWPGGAVGAGSGFRGSQRRGYPQPGAPGLCPSGEPGQGSGGGRAEPAQGI